MSATDITSTAKAVLSDPGFQTAFPVAGPAPEKQAPPEWLISILQSLADFVSWLAEMLPDSSGLSGMVSVFQGLGTVVQVLLLTILLFVAVMATVLAYRWLSPRMRNLTSGGTADNGTDRPARGSDRQDLLIRARKLIDAGDLDAAAACLFRAALGSVLDDDERRKRRSQTARRLVSQLQGDETTRRLLQRLVGLREAVHYAGRAPSPREFEDIFEDVSTLVRGQRAA
ncbi:MAG: hypothetical protein RIC36_11980 [Rhodospirillales bacterium]